MLLALSQRFKLKQLYCILFYKLIKFKSLLKRLPLCKDATIGVCSNLKAPHIKYRIIYKNENEGSL